MEQRDFIVREIEKIGQMLLGIIGKLKTKKQNEEFRIGLTIANQEFEEELGLSLSMLVKMDANNLEAFLSNHPGLDSDNQEIIADLLIDIGDEISDEPSLYFKQALEILMRINRQDRVFSMERNGKIEFLNSKLQEL